VASLYERAAALRTAGCQRQPGALRLSAGIYERGWASSAAGEGHLDRTKACDSGEGLGCATAARWYRQVDGIARSRARARWLRACLQARRKEFCPRSSRGERVAFG